VECKALHGDVAQASREAALAAFKAGAVRCLVATDVAARGLDIPNVEYVINYTFPLTIEDFVHRVGRTGRGGATGTAHTLFTINDKAHAGELVNVLREASHTFERPMAWRMNHRGQRALRQGRWKYLRVDGHDYLFDIEADARERANRGPYEGDWLPRMREAWETWNASMPAIPEDATVSLGYSVKDMPQR
jgi:superfamily II DNA/RNA helicase